MWANPYLPYVYGWHSNVFFSLNQSPYSLNLGRILYASPSPMYGDSIRKYWFLPPWPSLLYRISLNWVPFNHLPILFKHSIKWTYAHKLCLSYWIESHLIWVYAVSRTWVLSSYTYRGWHLEWFVRPLALPSVVVCWSDSLTYYLKRKFNMYILV